MDFNFSEQQDMLRTMARDFLANSCPKSRVRELDTDKLGYDPKVWRDMAELGWQGLVFPEEFGGTGADFLDLVILMEEMGRNILPGPFFSTIALCALPILEFGSQAQKNEFLPAIARGEKIWSPALTEGNDGYSSDKIATQAGLNDSTYVLNGEKAFVPYAHLADYFLVAARTSQQGKQQAGVTFFIADAKDHGIEIERIPTMALDRQFKVTFHDVKVPAGRIVHKEGQGSEVIDFLLQRAAVLKSGETCGACKAVLDMTSNYAKDRVQFGRPIASFQAVQNKLADMLVDVEALEYLLYQAAWEINAGKPSPLHIAAVKSRAARTYQNICVEGITAHGAVGFTLDCDIGLYYRCTRAMEYAAGDTSLHLEKIAAEMGLCQQSLR